MKGPHEILGVQKGATTEEIKAAYKTLIRKYHPDQFSDNPLKELAEEKLKELNDAYDKLVSKNNGSNGNGYSYKQSYSEGSSIYSQVRTLINQNKLQEAISILSGMSSKDGEWYYLMGSAYIKSGHYNQGYNYINIACRMDPTNQEYREGKARLEGFNSTYRSNPYRERRGSDMCNICSTLICMDCCCECMGGDLIACC